VEVEALFELDLLNFGFPLDTKKFGIGEKGVLFHQQLLTEIFDS
jgi:hypothetical protein